MNEEKELEKLMDSIFDLDQLEEPSLNFTSSVVEKIEAYRNERFAYAPLLPKWVLVVLGTLIVAFVAYVLNSSNSVGEQINYFENLNFSTSWIKESYGKLNFSTSLAYGIVGIGVLLCVQATMLNRFFNRPVHIA